MSVVVCTAVARALSVVLSVAVRVVDVRFAVGDAVDGQYHQKLFYGDVCVKTRTTWLRHVDSRSSSMRSQLRTSLGTAQCDSAE